MLKGKLYTLVVAGVMALVGAADANAATPRVLVFHPDTAGHPEVSAGVQAISALSRQGGFRVDATTRATDFSGANLGRFQAVVFLNTAGNRLNGEQEGALADFMEGGGGFVGIGTAAESEPGAALLDDLIGARPDPASPTGPATRTLEVGDRVHPATRDLPLELNRTDVWYRWLDRPTGRVHTVARWRNLEAPAGDGTSTGGTDWPISWCRDVRGGRSFYTGMGRTADSYGEQQLRGHLLRAIQWATGLVRGNCKATINASYSGTRVVSGGPVETGLATSGESHGLTIAPNGWVIYIGRGDCRTDQERGALVNLPSLGRILDHSDPNVGIGCGNVHVWDPSEYDGTLNGGVTRAGVLAVYGDGGQGGERTNQANHKLEYGLLGITVAPDFMQTGHVYMQYFPSFNEDAKPPGLPFERRVSKMSRPRISRFTMDLETKQLDLDSEVRIFEYDAQVFSCCHVGGGMGFDSAGNLYVTTGDTNSSQGTGGYSGNNQPPTCPTGPDTEASSQHCGSAAYSYQDARRTAGNTNDYNGKMLRINPIDSLPDGTQPPVGEGTTYTIPGAGSPNGPNLFDGSEGGGGKTKREIYAMGLRNPSRLSIDTETDTVYSAWVGPDAGRPSATDGPSTYENAAQIDRAGNYGWPFCMGNQQAYRDRLADGTQRTTNEAGYVPGGPAGAGTNGWYDCDDLVNDSIRNTGLTVLPHQTGTGRDAGRMRPVNVWYSRGNPDNDGNPQTNTHNGCPDFPRERGVDGAPNYGAVPRQLCPYATANGATIMNGPLYRFDEDAADDSVRWPEYWDGRWFLHNHGGPSIKHGLLLDPATDQDGGQPIYADSLRNTLSWQGNYMDSKFGPDGALYVQVYDGFFRANPNVGLYKYDYIGGPDTPGPDPQATPAGGRRVAFSIGQSGGVTYRWDFGDGRTSTAENPTNTYTAPGTYNVTLTVTYADGERASKTIQVPVS
jgi:glucose/arabinose dehydrogenase/type 1 glutamine amidotransferase